MICEHKRGYATIFHAARVVRGRQREGVGYLRVYQCDRCGMFHITHLKEPPVKPETRSDAGKWPERNA